MTPSQTEPSWSDPSQWPLWSLCLVTLYIGVAWLGWSRTLIPDEIIGLLMIERPLAELLDFARNDLVQTPLSYFVALRWMGAFGGTDAVAKTLPLVLGAISLTLFTLLATQVTVHWRIASVLFWASYLRIGSAPNLVRMYALVMLLVLVAVLIWNRWRLEGKVRYLAIWAGVMAVLFYTHGSGLLLLPAFVLSTWIYGPRRWRPQLLFHCAAMFSLLALLPWIGYVMPVMQQKGVESNIEWISDGPNSTLGKLPFYFLSGEEPGGYSPVPPLHRRHRLRVLKWVALIVHFSLFVMAWPLLRRMFPPRSAGNDDASWTGICLIFCAIPVFSLYTFSVLISPALHPRYLVIELPFYFLLLVLLGFGGLRQNRIVLICVILPWLLVNSTLTLLQHARSVPVSQGVGTVAREIQNRDLVIANQHVPLGLQVEWEWTHRYGGGNQVQVLRSDLPAWLLEHFPGVRLQDLELTTANRVWFFKNGHPSEVEVEESLRTIGFTSVSDIDGDEYRLTLYERSDLEKSPRPETPRSDGNSN